MTVWKFELLFVLIRRIRNYFPRCQNSWNESSERMLSSARFLEFMFGLGRFRKAKWNAKKSFCSFFTFFRENYRYVVSGHRSSQAGAGNRVFCYLNDFELRSERELQVLSKAKWISRLSLSPWEREKPSLSRALLLLLQATPRVFRSILTSSFSSPPLPPPPTQRRPLEGLVVKILSHPEVLSSSD